MFDDDTGIAVTEFTLLLDSMNIMGCSNE